MSAHSATPAELPKVEFSAPFYSGTYEHGAPGYYRNIRCGDKDLDIVVTRDLSGTSGFDLGYTLLHTPGVGGSEYVEVLRDQFQQTEDGKRYLEGMNPYGEPVDIDNLEFTPIEDAYIPLVVIEDVLDELKPGEELTDFSNDDQAIGAVISTYQSMLELVHSQNISIWQDGSMQSFEKKAKDYDAILLSGFGPIELRDGRPYVQAEIYGVNNIEH